MLYNIEEKDLNFQATTLHFSTPCNQGETIFDSFELPRTYKKQSNAFMVTLHNWKIFLAEYIHGIKADTRKQEML